MIHLTFEPSQIGLFEGDSKRFIHFIAVFEKTQGLEFVQSCFGNKNIVRVVYSMQYSQVVEQEMPTGGFSLPALELPSKHYSLEADLATGWQPKMKVVGPVPLNFDATVQDELIETLTTFGARHSERVVYLGPRYASSFKLQQQMKKDYIYKYQAIVNTNFPHLAAYFRKFYGHFKPKIARPFKGMNPTLKQGQSAHFDSFFQSGNLDAVIKLSAHQYDLFMRVDSNTRGHLQWFNFTVRSGHQKKVKFNIANFRRSKTMYNAGMRPYFWSSHQRGSWKQLTTKVKYDQKILSYSFLKDIFSEERLQFSCLSFQYEFQNQEEIVRFAYCPPFTYSDNVSMINSLRTSAEMLGEGVLKEEVAGQTLGGLEIPLLTITDPEVPDAFKKCVVASARIHPGQTCGSYMVKGFLQFLCSGNPVAAELRKQIVFKVIPMANPDGVVVGNFRTSLCGRDLNRMFRSDQSLLIPEVVGLKSLVAKLKSEFKGRLQFFLDFHGHSVRKNVFIYGPEYQIWQNNYYRTRILPKLISQKTEMFRYYSCIFRISSEKKTTARAVLMKQIPHCYTVEASVASFYSHSQKKDYDFSPSAWQSMGKMVSEGMFEYFKVTQQNNSKKKEKGKESSLPKVKMSGSKTRKRFSQSKSQMQDIRKTNLEKTKNAEQQMIDMEDQNQFSEEAKDLIESIKQADKELKVHADKYSEGGSDSEGSDDDLPEKQLNTLHHQIILSIKQFKERFYNRGEPGRAKSFLQSSVHLPPKKLEMIASLRKKAEQNVTTKSEVAIQRGSTQGETKIWVRGQSTRRSAGYQGPSSENFHVYVTKLKAARQQEEKCRISYFSPRKKASH